MSSVAC